eukprot:2951932-Alexandrium_andersonii.AAC.1
MKRRCVPRGDSASTEANLADTQLARQQDAMPLTSRGALWRCGPLAKDRPHDAMGARRKSDV